MEEGPQVLPLPNLEPISRPDSASTVTTTSLTQLPGISSLAAATETIPSPIPTTLPVASAPSPQSRPVTVPNPTMYAASPAATSGGSGGNLPTCQNCSTSTTPLWRRDEFGSVLCNACGLFLKLHGRPRPISLKTDVIKSRNRVKTLRPDLGPKKKQQQQAHNFNVASDPSGVDISAQAATAAHAAHAARRTSQKSANGQEGSDSPISRTGTPSMYNHGLSSFMVDDPYSTGVAGFTNVEGRAGSPLNGDRGLDAPQTHEQLIAHNSSLKTRVSELEVINELFRGRLSQLEQQEAAARRGQEVAGVEQAHLRSQFEALQESEAQLRAQLEDSHRRENSLKRRLDELELELKAAKDDAEAAMERPAKKPRLVEPTPQQEEAIEDAPTTTIIEPSAPPEQSETTQDEAPMDYISEIPEVSDAPKTTQESHEDVKSELAEVAQAVENAEIPEPAAEAPKETEVSTDEPSV